MKPSLLLSFLTGVVVVVSASAADALQEALQRGLLAEEARHDLKAAADAYAEVVRLADGQRAIVATAVFRLAETRRRLGQTNEATTGYQRLIREFPEQTNLVAIASLRMPQDGRNKATAAEVATLAAEVDRMEAQFFDVQRRLEQTRSLLASLKSKSGRELRSILNSARPTPLLQSLLQDLATTEIQKTSLNPDLGPEHPDVRRIKAATENLNQQIDTVVQGIMAGLELQVAIDKDHATRMATFLEMHRQELRSVADQVVRDPSRVNADRLANLQAETAERLLREEPLLAALRTKSRAELVQALAVSRPTSMLEKLLSDRSTAEQQRAAIDVDLGPEHPDVKRSRRVLEKLAEQIDAEAKGILDALESSIAEQKASLAAIERQRAEARKAAAAVRDDPERLLLDEIAVAEEQLATARTKAGAGAGPQEDVLKAQREVLALRRQLAALPRLQTVGDVSANLEAERPSVFVLGAVNAPGRVVLPSDKPMDLAQAIAVSGGLGKGADRKRIVVRRDNQQLKVSFDDAMASKFELKAGDVIEVKNSVF